jgi:hypothetical protein
MGEAVSGSVEIPRDARGQRSSSALGRTVVAAALHEVDPTGALAAEQETNWRSGYLDHVRRLTEAGLVTSEAAHTIAADGLAVVYECMVVAGEEDEPDQPLASLRDADAGREIVTHTIVGDGEPESELTVPHAGRRLGGDDLRRQLDTWARDGTIEPTVTEAVERVLANPEWLRLEGRTVVVLGAGAEIGPLNSLLAWGATVAAADLPRRPIWERILATAREHAGTLLVPLDGPRGLADDPELAGHAGIDLTTEVPAAADWIAGLDGVPVLGTYAYADGAAHVRVTVAIDALGERVRGVRPDAALAFLATPTDVFAVPAEAVEHSVAAYAQRSATAKLLGRPLRTVSGGRLLRRNYVPGADPGVCDALVAQQGPNYALAKRIQRWRATHARAQGTLVSLNVAPSTRTRSVVKNRVLAAAYAGAHRFGIEVFEPETTNALMAALLVHDLHTDGGPAQAHPWQQEAHAAAHGGLWRAAYAPRSALGLATVLGIGASRS